MRIVKMSGYLFLSKGFRLFILDNCRNECFNFNKYFSVKTPFNCIKMEYLLSLQVRLNSSGLTIYSDTVIHHYSGDM